MFSVQNLDPCKCDCEDCGLFYRSVMAFGVGGITICASVIVLTHYIWTRKNTITTGYERIADSDDED